MADEINAKIRAIMMPIPDDIITTETDDADDNIEA